MNRSEWFVANFLLSLGILALALVTGVGLPGFGAFLALPLAAGCLLELAGHPLPISKNTESSDS